MTRFLFALILFLPNMVIAAQGYVPLVDLPGITLSNTPNDISQYINALYLLAISGAAFLAVFKIVSGGVKYTLSDVVTDKGDAKKDIKGAILGLLIVLSAVLVLRTINPSLVDLNILKNAGPVDGSSGGSFSLMSVFKNEDSGVIQIGQSSGKDIENLLDTCTDVRAIGDNQYCCNNTNNNTCPANTVTDDIDSETNLNNNKVYTWNEYNTIIKDLGSNVLALPGNSSQYSNQRIQQDCQTYADRQGLSLNSVENYTIDVTGSASQLSLEQRTVCVFN